LQEWLHARGNISAESLFVSLHKNCEKGNGIQRRGIRKMVDSYLLKLSLKRKQVSCHALRHSFATLSRAAGAKLDAISKALGHHSVTTTQIYADIVDMRRENPASLLIGLLDFRTGK
jgi:site-specific recombinase XerD